jgi:hypothetical protein
MLTMSAPSRYIRLFDLAKYREIQPITDRINERNVDLDPEKVIGLIKRAIDVAQSSDFKKYNSEFIVRSFISEIEEGLEVMQEGSILDWDSHGTDKLNTIISLVCCPKYQFLPVDSGDHKPDAFTVIDYTAFCYSNIEPFNRRLYKMLNDGRSEILPSDNRDEAAAWVFTRQELTELAIMVKQDLADLSQPDCVLYKIYEGDYYIDGRDYYMKTFSASPRELGKENEIIPVKGIQATLIELYVKLDHITKKALLNPNHTIINEAFI